ncbi:MAG: hypothetical protein RLZZ84_167 [Pseudomonadota bacterium]|jgi:phytoene desaturase
MTDTALQSPAHASPARIFQGKRTCVIGAGLGGLALAIRLQAAGIETVLIEARDRPGGRAGSEQQAGFTFDTGPTTITDPAAFAELWAMTGHDMADDIELLPVAPFCRFSWPDGVHFDLSGEEPALTREIARLSPADLAGYDDLARHAAAALTDRRARLSGPRTRDLAGLVNALPVLLRHQAWRSLQGLVASFVKHDRLRQVLSFNALRRGANPLATSAIALADHALEQQGGVWAAKGGTNRLVAAMLAQFERLGGTVRLHDPVLTIHTLGNRASEVETQSGWKERFDAVASNADVVHTYRDLLSGLPRGPEMARSLAQRRFSPGLFVVHFALEGSWPGIPHNMVLMASRHHSLLEDIFDHGVLPRDFMVMLSHPSITDPSLAPEGKSLFSAAVPVANQGKLPIDWEQVGPMLEQRVLDEIGRRLVPDIHDRIITKFHVTPRDFALDLNSHLGSAWGLEPTHLQDWLLRPPNRDAKLANVYLVGAGTYPGAGVPAVLASAKATAKLVLEDLR